MLKFNILSTNQCYANYMHNDKSIKLYKEACFKVFYNISKILEKII